MKDSSNRKPIKEELKREVRREAYFGCVRCGNPLIEYHHINPYAKVKEHNISNLVALCPTCHSAYHSRMISRIEIEQWKKNPYNKNEDNIKSLISVGQYDELQFVLGTNTFIQTENLIVINDQPIIRVTYDKYNHPLIDAIFYDKDQNLIGSINKNEWTVDLKYQHLWDFKYTTGVLQLNAGERNPLFKLELFPDESKVYLTTRYYYNGVYFNITPSKIELLTDTGEKKTSNMIMTNNIIKNAKNGIFLSV